MPNANGSMNPTEYNGPGGPAAGARNNVANPGSPNTIMVNGKAMSRDDFWASVQNNSLAAGPGGQAAANAMITGTYDPNALANQPGSTPNQSNQTPASNPKGANQQGNPNATTANPNAPGGQTAAQANGAPQNAGAKTADQANGTPAGQAGAANPFTGQSDSSLDQAKPEYMYGWHAGDTGQSFANRAGWNALSAMGPSAVNPDLAANPNANSPFASWFQSRYMSDLPTNQMVANILSGGGMMGSDIAGGLKSVLQSGNVNGPSVAGAQQNLQGLAGKLTNVQNNVSNGGPQDSLNAQALYNNPQLQLQMLQSQLAGVGGFGANYLNSLGNSMLNTYYNNPSMQPGMGGSPFLNQVMQKIGMGTN